MEALRYDVVAEALKIQQILLGPEVSCSSPLGSGMFTETTGSGSDGGGDSGNGDAGVDSGSSGIRKNASNLGMGTGMFFHSPLLYWNCSLSAMKDDANLIMTVNREFAKRSPANVTLRWGSVFAGKKFRHNRLIGADALVISLFYRLDSPAGRLWDQRATVLAQEADVYGRYDVYPGNGKENGSTLYEVPFLSLSGTELWH